MVVNTFKSVKLCYGFIIGFIFFNSTNNLTAQTVIWLENFETGYSDNDAAAQDNNLPAGADWTKTGTSSTWWRVDNDNVLNGSFSMSGRNTDAVMTWTSEAIDISSFSDVEISIALKEVNCEGGDIIETFYNIDGSGNTEFGDGNGDGGFDDATNTVTGLSGSSLVITVTLENNGNGERLIFDDITVTGTAQYSPCDFKFRKTFSFDPDRVEGGADLINFPVLIDITDIDLSSGTGHVQNANGYDIVFYDKSICTFVDFQVEKYDASTGELVVWVEIPTYSATEITEIDMLYGLSTISTDQSSNSTWGNQYSAIYHLGTGDYDDYTSSGHNGTPTGAVDNANGVILGAQTLGPTNPTDERITIPGGSLSAAAGTIEFWGMQTTFNANEQYFVGHTTQPAFVNRIQIYTDDANGMLDLGLGNSHTLDTDIMDLNTNQWYHFALTWNGTNYAFYVDGNLESSGNYTGLTTIDADWDIGNNGNTGGRTENMIGSIDEFRVSTTDRTAGWIETSYNNQENQGIFYSISTNELYACDTLYSISSADWNTPGTWSLTSGGCSCACIPKGTDSSTVFIEGNDVVTLTAADEIGHLIIGTSTGAGAGPGTLQWGGGFDLDIYGTEGSIDIRNNGSLDRNGNNAWSLDFDNTPAANYTLNNDGFFDIHEFDLGNATLTISGSSSMLIRDDINIRANNSILTNNNTIQLNDDIDINNFTTTINNNGNFDINGEFTDVEAGEVVYHNNTGSTTNYSGANTDDNDIRIEANTGENTFTYDRSGDQDVHISSSKYWHLVLDESGTKTAVGDFDIAGNFTNNVDWDSHGSTHTFSGIQAQNIGGTSEVTFHNLIINNANDEITLLNDVNIANSLTLIAGNIITTATDILTVEDNATSTLGSDNSFVDGPMRKEGDDDNFIFPVGDGGTWAALGMINIGNFDASTLFTCEYFFNPAPNPRNKAAGISHVSGIEYWTLDRTIDPGNNASLQVRLYWDSETESDITNLADHSVGHYTTEWTDEGGTITDNGTDGYVTSEVVNTFSPFTFISSIGYNSLPVELVSFEAEIIDEHTLLTWITATEENNSHFLVERSLDGNDWNVIGNVKGSGNSTNLLVYSFEDKQPLDGHNYYRLIQVDLDGTSTETPVEWVIFDHFIGLDFLIYPNPAQDIINIKFNEEYEDISIQLIDMHGKLIIEKENVHILNEKIHIGHLPSATYILKIIHYNDVVIEKLVKQ